MQKLFARKVFIFPADAGVNLERVIQTQHHANIPRGCGEKLVLKCFI